MGPNDRVLQSHLVRDREQAHGEENIFSYLAANSISDPNTENLEG
jgi:hypothetical protein